MKLTSEQYLLLGYIVGVGVLLGYAAKLWLNARRLGQRESRHESNS
ncbi:MAG: hypothetical protein ACF8NJ_09370 [Phycisphaerales bacterium JB038]